MRAIEFIVEYKLKVSKDADGVAIKATADGKSLGHAEFFFDEEGRLDPQSVWVDERYQGQGIARDMYDHLKNQGYTIIRSWDQTDAGRGFWNKHRGKDAQVWEAEQKILDPEIYDDVSNSLLKRAVQGALPGVALKFKTTPEGYLSVRDADGFVKLDIGMSMAGGAMDFNVANAYLSKYAKGGSMTKIIADSFALAEKKYGIPQVRSLSIMQDRSHGVWQAIANKLGLEYGTHRLNEASSNLNSLHNRKNYQRTLQVLQLAYGEVEGQQMLDQYIQAVDQLIQNGGTVYRGIWVAPGTKPRLKDAGQHWALTLQAAEEYLDSDAGWGAYGDFQDDDEDIQPEPYIISATVGPNSITNKGVFFDEFPEEMEVRLVNPQTAKMKIVKKVKGLVPESRLNEAITRDKVRAALWHEWQQDAWLDQGEQSPEEMDDEEYNDFEETVDEIVAWATAQGIESSQLAVTKYNMAMDQLTMAHLTGSQGLAENQLDEISRDRLERYLSRAGRQVDTRQERMARARQRLSRSYEIYHADKPTKIVDRFEADTPADAQRYYQDYIENYQSDVDYDLRLRRSTGIDENFADGRVKGKSRPGRVKRAGASCSGSVTSLRAKARNYGGEKGKMYHWCANMKSGRKKNK